MADGTGVPEGGGERFSLNCAEMVRSTGDPSLLAFDRLWGWLGIGQCLENASVQIVQLPQ